jgi:hypothetical protein
MNRTTRESGSGSLAPSRADPREGGFLRWWSTKGAATQAVVPGLYAWAITVAAPGWVRGAPVVAKVASGLALLVLLIGPVVERWAPNVARLGVGWGLVLGAVVTWMVAPETAMTSFDAARGIAGMFGWALFAFAIASPARPARSAIVSSEPLAPRTEPARHDAPLLLVGVLLAAGLEIPGWNIEQRDRSLLLRIVALAGGLGLLSASSAIAVGRHRVPGDGSRQRRRRFRVNVVGWASSAFLLLGAGAAYELWRRP